MKPATKPVEPLAGINLGLELTALLLAVLLSVSVLAKASEPQPGRSVTAREGRRVEKVDTDQKARTEMAEMLRDMARHD